MKLAVINIGDISTADIDKVEIKGKGDVVYFMLDGYTVLAEIEIQRGIDVRKQYEVKGGIEQEGERTVEGVNIIECWIEDDSEEELECDYIKDVEKAVLLRASDIIDLFIHQ